MNQNAGVGNYGALKAAGKRCVLRWRLKELNVLEERIESGSEFQKFYERTSSKTEVNGRQYNICGIAKKNKNL